MTSPQAPTDTIRGTWFDAFEPAVQSGQLQDGTTVMELGWRSAWFQSYHMVFILDKTSSGHDVTHIGLLSNGDAGDEWMRIESIRISIYEDAQQLQLGFSMSGDWDYDGEPLLFEDSITADPAALAPKGLSDFNWGSRAAIDVLLGTASPFAIEQGEWKVQALQF